MAGLGGEHLREAGPFPGPGEDVGQGPDGGEVSGLVREHLLVVGPGLGRVARRLRPHPGQPEVEAGGRARLDSDRERLPEGGFRLGGAVERPVEQFPQFEEGPAPRPRVGLHRSANPEQAGEALGVAALPVAALQGSGDLAVGGGEPVRHLEEAERLVRLAVAVDRGGTPGEQARPGGRGQRIVLGDGTGQAARVGEECATHRLGTGGGVPAVDSARHRHAEQQRGLPLAAGGIGRPLEERDEIAGGPVRGCEPLQGRECPLRGRRVLEGPPPGIPGARRISGAGLQHLGQLLEQRGALRGLGHARDEELGDPGPRAPVAGFGVEGAQRIEGGATSRVAAEGLGERRGGLQGPAARRPVGGGDSPRLGGLRPRTEATGPGLEHPGAVVGVARCPEDGGQPVEVGVARDAERHHAPPFLRHGGSVARGDAATRRGRAAAPARPSARRG